MAVGVFGIILGIVWLSSSGISAGPWVFMLLMIAAGVGLIVGGRYLEKMHLPIPHYSSIKEAASRKREVKQEEVKAMEAKLRKEGEERKGKRGSFYLLRSYEALAECDYVQAHIAARVGLEKDKKSIPGHMALAVAAGGLNQGQVAGIAVNYVLRKTGMKGETAAWGAGWALALAGDWLHAEAFLEQGVLN